MDAIVDNMASLDNLSKQQILQERRLLAESGVISYASLLPVIEKLTQETFLFGCICSIINPSRTQPLCG